MEFVILGLLMLQAMTGYEISKFVKNYLSMICSESAGSMQEALKKLLAAGSIGYDEFVENSKNKKVFHITEIGKAQFADWIKNPMQTEKIKNMELSKLFFLGLAPNDLRGEAIQGYIAQLEQTKIALLAMKTEFEGFKISPSHDNDTDTLLYQKYTLDYGIASVAFEIRWYTELLDKIG